MYTVLNTVFFLVLILDLGGFTCVIKSWYHSPSTTWAESIDREEDGFREKTKRGAIWNMLIIKNPSDHW